ncbi:MAG TPA: AbrB/MazE/SpoVT family DNA-binding domain-containing protein [Crenalkalicoccus sp.]|jgi:AbrB family looped-hinge helix DNA binding protein|nr:AbrB/MazE/SpoVT family DNA-binding domain-containing protein [Crenalkalicoccus sp.]
MGMPVTVKGQVTIPKAIRDRLGLVPGSEVEFAIEPDGRVLLRKAGPTEPSSRSRFAEARRAPGWNGMTTDEIMRLTRGED